MGFSRKECLADPEEANTIVEKFRQYISAPVLSQIHVRWKDFDACDVVPAKLPDLFALCRIILFGKWGGPATGTFEVEGFTSRGLQSIRIDVAGVQPEDSHRAIRYLWARSRIPELSDYGSTLVDSESCSADYFARDFNTTC